MNYIYFYIRSTPIVLYLFLFLFSSTPIFSQKIQWQQSIGGNQINYTDLETIEVVGNNSFLPDYISGAYNHAVASGQYGRYSPYKPDAFSFSLGFSFQGIFGEASLSIGIAVANGDAALVVGTGGGLGIKPSIPGVKTGAQFAFHDNYGIIKMF